MMDNYPQDEISCEFLDDGSMVPENFDWIMVATGSVEDVEYEVQEHMELFEKKRPTSHAVEIFAHRDDFFVIHFSPGLQPYTFCNLISWLDAPPSESTVEGAVGWYTSPGDRKRYVLFREEDNYAGDTLVGVSDEEESVRVYLPECALSNAGRPVVCPQEPTILQPDLQLAAAFVIEDEAPGDFGNPRFLDTGPP